MLVVFFFFLTNMFSQLTVFFISRVVRINLSSQKMLRLHVQFIMLWDWFVKNVNHPKVWEQHTIAGSPACVCHRSLNQDMAKFKKPAWATKKIVTLSTSCQTTDYCQMEGWNVNGISDFCCCCALTLTVGPRRGESCAWPSHRPFFLFHSSFLHRLDIKPQLQVLSNPASWPQAVLVWVTFVG